MSSSDNLVANPLVNASSRETICAVVVTYNRKQLLMECLDALRKQTRPIDAMYIIDNFSNDGTPELLLENNYISVLPPEDLSEPWEKEFEIKSLTAGASIKIFYVRMHENTGGAGGFHEGVKRGYERGYDWLWLMDDDVSAKEDGIDMLLRYGEVADCIHPSKVFFDGTRFHWDQLFNEKTGRVFLVKQQRRVMSKGLTFKTVNYGCFEGMFIHRNLIRKIGLPDPRFFIMQDDLVYGFLASKMGRNICIDEICLTKMRKTTGSKARLLWLTSIRVSNSQLYYGIRNSFLTIRYLREYSEFSAWGYVYSGVRILRYLTGILLFDNSKYRRIRIFIRAIQDGLLWNYGKATIDL